MAAPYDTRGLKGDDGASAYDVWLAAGNSGDVNAYLASLKGAKGDKGDTGARGAPYFHVPLITEALTYTNMPAAFNIWQGSTFSTKTALADLVGYTECRLGAVVQNAFVPTAVIQACYAAPGTFEAITGAQLPLAVAYTNGMRSSWVALPERMRTLDSMLRLYASGGDGNADPTIAKAWMEFR